MRPAADEVALGIFYGDGEAVIAIQTMGCAANSGVVGTHRHFDLVQDACVHMAAFQAIASKPFLRTSANSLSEGPRGCFSPRSHWLTNPVVTFK